MNKQSEESINLYNVPYSKAKISTNSSHKNRRKANNSLPSINFQKIDKINEIRDEVSRAKDQISLLQARINSLKFQKSKNDKKRSGHEKQAEFIKTIKERFNQQKIKKKQQEEQRQQQLELLKEQATHFKEQIKRKKQLSTSISKEKRFDMAEEQRKKRKYDEEYIKYLRSIELEEKRVKAKCIKQQQAQIQLKMKDFNKSRLIFAKQNHQKKIENNLRQKKNVQKILAKLRKEENEIMGECKKSQASMLISLKELQTLMPESAKVGNQSSRKNTSKLDLNS